MSEVRRCDNCGAIAVRVDGWFKVTRLTGFGASVDNGFTEGPAVPLGDFCSPRCLAERAGLADPAGAA